MSKIYPNLYLGDRHTSKNGSFIKKSKITHILIAGNRLRRHFTKKCAYMQLDIFDHPSAKIINHFIESIQYIEEALAGGNNILIHCWGGVSRSATIVIAYIMVKEKKSLDEALQFVRQKRSMIRPNPGFMAQLELFEKCLKYYFENTKGEKIDYPFLMEALESYMEEYEDLKVKKMIWNVWDFIVLMLFFIFFILEV